MTSKTTHRLLFTTLMFVGFSGLAVGGLFLTFLADTRFPPQTTLDGIPIGMLTPDQALVLYTSQSSPIPTEITIQMATTTATIRTSDLKPFSNPEDVLTSYQNETPTILGKINRFIGGLINPTRLDVPLVYDHELAAAAIASLSARITTPSRPSGASLGKSGVLATLVVDPGQQGITLDATSSAAMLDLALYERRNSVNFPILLSGTTLSPLEVTNLRTHAEALVGRRITAETERVQFSLDDRALIAALQPDGTLSKDALIPTIESWQKQTGTAPQDPELEYDQTTLRVTKFVPPRNGRTIELNATAEQLNAAIAQLAADPNQKSAAIQLAITEAPPTHKLADLNNLGIVERIGFGESYYSHSIPNRIHNVAITSERVNNIIVPPGAEFSFNKTLGDVSAETGYKSAYVIKNGKTELGDGGGVCQVSTTLFRSVVNAGLEVTRRLPHSYRVSYYELDRKPGFDATVYAGETDFRFKNDTPGHLLIHTIADSKRTYMYVEIYGTSDGRTTKIVEHKTWDPRPAPPPQYFPDPTLPVGKTVQIDWSAPGIRASITNVVYNADGTERRRDTYVSNYKPWAAKYLQGVAP